MSPQNQKVSLRVEDKLIVLVVSLVVVMMVSVTLVTNRRQMHRLERAIKGKAMSHSQILAISNVEQLLKKDYVALGSALDEIVRRDPDIAYIAVYDEEGQAVVARSRATLGRESSFFIDGLLRESIEITLASKIEKFQAGKGEFIYDTTVPVKVPGLHRAPVGAVRIGFIPRLFKEIFADIWNQNIMLTALFVVLGMIGALVLGRLLNKQIDATVAARSALRGEALPGEEYDLEKALKGYLPEYGERFDDAYKKLSSQDLFALFKAAREIPTAPNFKEALRLSAQIISDVMRVSELIIFLKDEKTKKLQARMGYDAQGPMSDEALAGIMVEEGRGEVWMASQFGTSSFIDTPKPASGIVSPLTRKGKTVGVIEIRSRLSGTPFDQKNQLLLELLGSLIATSIEKTEPIEERKEE